MIKRMLEMGNLSVPEILNDTTADASVDSEPNADKKE